MKKLLLILLLLPGFAEGQIISTIAGTGTAGHTGDGGLAIAAQLQAPWGVVTDSIGNLFFADAGNNCIRKINAAGIISTIAGTGTAGYSGDGGPAIAAQMNTPVGIAIDDSGNVFFADYWNNRIRKINTAGIISTVAGDGVIGYTGDGGPAIAATLNNPSGVAIDVLGNIYIADNDNFCIRKVNTSGVISTYAGTNVGGYLGDGGPATAARISNEASVIVDRTGNLYISDRGNSRVRFINTSGIISTVAGNGSSGYSGDGGLATAAQIGTPYFSALDRGGNLFISDVNGYIRKVTPAGIISTIAGGGGWGSGGDGGPAIAAQFRHPYGISVNAAGAVYIADGTNNRIRRINGISPIMGPAVTCVGATISLSDSTTGGIWSSSNLAVGTIDSVTGVFTGISVGSSTITYNVGPNYVTTVITVASVSYAGTITGASYLCPLGTGYADSQPGGVWGLTDTSVAHISAIGFVLPAYSGPTIPDTVTYIVTTSCGSDTARYPIALGAPCTTQADDIIAAMAGFSVYPNPSADEITITSPDKITSVSIINLVGQSVYSLDCNAGQIQIRVAGLPTGVYIIRVNGTVIRKLVKQ